MKAKKRASMSQRIEGGGVSVEAAIVVVTALFMIAILTDLGTMVATYNQLIGAVRAGTRVATATDGLKGNDAAIADVVRAFMPGSNVQVENTGVFIPYEVRNASNVVCSNAVTVRASVPFSPFMRFIIGTKVLTLRYELTMRHNLQDLCY